MVKYTNMAAAHSPVSTLITFQLQSLAIVLTSHDLSPLLPLCHRSYVELILFDNDGVQLGSSVAFKNLLTSSIVIS